MYLTVEQFDDIVFDVMLEEYWNSDDELLEEGWLDAIKGTVKIARKFGLDDKVAELALQKIVGVGKGDSMESVMSLLSMVPDGGEEAGETGAGIAGMLGDVMPAFKALTKGNKKMDAIFAKYDDAKAKFEEIYEKVEPIKQWLVDNADNVKEVVALIKARDVKGLDAFMGDIIPDVAHKKLKRILKKISKVVGKVGDMFTRFIDFVVKIDEFFGDGALGGGDDDDEGGATPSGEEPATGSEAKEWREEAAEDLSHLKFADIKDVAVKAVKQLRANEYYEPKYNVLYENPTYSLRFYTLTKKQINEQLLQLAADVRLIAECGCMDSPVVDQSVEEEIDSEIINLVDDLVAELPGEEGRMLDYGSQKSDSAEGKMTRSKLFRMGQMSQRLHDILFDEDDLPGWVNDKVTTAEDRLKSAHDYITYKVRK